MPTTLDKAVKYLRQFKTVASLRAECRRRKVKGRKGDVEGCPIQKLLNVVYSGGGWAVGPNNVYCRAEIDRRPTPPLVRRFIKAFDAGKYPELEAR